MRILTSLALLAACSDSQPARDANFQNATPAQLGRTIEAAAGIDFELAILTASVYATATVDSTACPQVVAEATRLHVIGGCTADGTRITGSAYLTNVPNFIGTGSDPSKPSSVEFDNFKVVDPDGTTLRFDGTLTYSATSSQVALETVLHDISARVDASFTCSGIHCTYSHASLEVDGVGGATVTGSWATDYSTVAIDVRGKDDLAISGSGKCLTYSIDGVAATDTCQ